MIKKFKELMKEAHEIITEKEANKEDAKRGILRAGSSGAIVNGDVYATQCGRLAQARLLGHQSSPTQEMRVMFVGGFALEDFIEERLKTLNLTYKKEEQCEETIAKGVTISGRPDFDVLLNEEWVGIEVKSLASPFSVIKQRKNKFPFMKHLLQAATYMTMLQRNKWLIVIGHTYNVNQNGVKHNSEIVWYEVTWDGKIFGVSNEQDLKTFLPFTKDHIIAYYKEVQLATKEQRLMSRPKEQELNVDTYNRCKYCPMESACNQYENGQIDFEQWLEKVSEPKE